MESFKDQARERKRLIEEEIAGQEVEIAEKENHIQSKK